MLRALLILCLLTGLLLPKMGAAIASALPNVITAVICTPDGIRVLHIGQDGAPVEMPTAAVDHCLADAPIPATTAPDRAWVQLARDHRDPFLARPASQTPTPYLRGPPPQGPPALI